MSTAPPQARPYRSARRRWRTRLAGFGLSGWIGLCRSSVSGSLAAIVGPALRSRTRAASAAARCSRPSARRIWLGTDYLGRDMLSRG